VAITRGPVVYCLEEADNGRDLNALATPSDAAFALEDSELTGTALPSLAGEGVRRSVRDWGSELYRPADADQEEVVELRAIPYAEWANRERGEMLVWVREASCGATVGE
jgi:hypothetical protein